MHENLGSYGQLWEVEEDESATPAKKVGQMGHGVAPGDGDGSVRVAPAHIL
jgi:hypothetical protein